MAAHILGFPRIGARRELKAALESYWSGKSKLADLLACGRELRARHWQLQRDAGLDFVTVGDFAYYDQMLNMTAMLGAAPKRFGFAPGEVELEQIFVMARGSAEQPAMEMTKWFDTNYHYIVPEFKSSTTFEPAFEALFRELVEARALDLNIKPVLIGPLTYLYLGKEKEPAFNRLSLLPRLLPVYQEVLARLKDQGIEWVQIDEPALVLDLPPEWLAALSGVYKQLAPLAPKILLATYFAAIDHVIERLAQLPIAGLHIDLVRAPEQLGACVDAWPAERVLSLGLVDGRNIWRCDLDAAIASADKAKLKYRVRLWVAPSCSLLHCPVDLDLESALDAEIKTWLAFAKQKLAETVLIQKALAQPGHSAGEEIAAAGIVLRAQAHSPRRHNPAVQTRLAALTPTHERRRNEYIQRRVVQQARFALPLLPTTTIGSFPQTPEIRRLRAALKSGEMTEPVYRARIRAEIEMAVRKQEALGIDVLVHGEAERNDMVEYFGEQLNGFAFTENGWVQSYGSRCVKPPLIYGDVSRAEPMTLEWTAYAQSLTDRPMKGMLTGPVTILQWSFVRTDQARATTALQIALAIRDEVSDLEQAGIGMIQIDEPAFREGLPLKRAQWPDYLQWAGRAFRVSASVVDDATQIHTHMCYSEFNDILDAIADLDADVITIETSRSDMELLDAFADFSYPNAIGPGVYDIHSSRVPETGEMIRLLEKALAVIPAEQLWVNPDCGLKTRGWPEVEAALKRMVEAAIELRARLAREHPQARVAR